MSDLKGIKFQLLKNEKVKDHCEFEVNKSTLYSADGSITEGGPLDNRFGCKDPSSRCAHCENSSNSCMGHEGYLQLAAPVLNPGLRDHFKKFLSRLCIDCMTCNSTNVCGTCKNKIKYLFITPYLIKRCEVVENNLVWKTLYLPSLYEKIKLIPEEQVRKITTLSVEDFFITNLVVPCINVRPNIKFEGKVLTDHLTIKLQSIVFQNQKLKNLLEMGYTDKTTEQTYYLFTYEIFTYMDNKISKIPVSTFRGGKPVKSLLQRLESKEGLLRSNLRGKRTTYTARCVLTPDPQLEIDQVGVPLTLAVTLTKPVVVTNYNYDEVVDWINSEEYVKATYYEHKLPSGDFVRLKVSSTNKDIILEKLSPGDIIHRNLITGDYVVINRAPTIHRYGLMGHRVVVYQSNKNDNSTIKLNPSICLPYNADFDGDEVHLHVPQNVSAQIDVQMYMHVMKNLKDSKNRLPIIGIQKQLLTAAYNMTLKNPTFTRSEAVALMGADFIDNPEKDDYDGRSIISMCLDPGFNYSNNDIEIKNGQLLKGVFTSKTISRKSDFSEVLMTYSDESFRSSITKLLRLFRNYYKYLGHSICVDDYELNIDDQLETLKQEFTQKATEKVEEAQNYSRDYQLQTHMLVQKTLNELDNPAIQMAKSGSSGSIMNLIQMSSNIIGQRYVRGEIPQDFFGENEFNRFTGSALTSMLYKTGIIWNGYKNGLSFLDFVNDSLYARDATLTNQIKITHMGYFSRRLICSLSDLYIDHNNMVVDSKNRIIQTKFGGNGINLEDYKPGVPNKELKKIIEKNEEGATLTKEEVKNYLKEQGYDDLIYKIIEVNTYENKKFTKEEVNRLSELLLIPHGSTIGVATGHAIGEPSTQLTLSAKHKLSGTHTALERLVSLIDRALVEPSCLLTAQSQQAFQRIQKLLPVKVSEKYSFTVDPNVQTIVINNIDFLDKQALLKIINDVDQMMNLTGIKTGLELKQEIDSIFIKFHLEQSTAKVLSTLKYFLQVTQNRLLQGFDQIKRSLVNLNNRSIYITGNKNTNQLYKLIDNLKDEGLKGVNVKFLDPVYLEQRHGIEHARKLMYEELVPFLKQSLHIDTRYLSMFCDLVTYTGRLNALNRSGVIKLKSPLTRCAFEAFKKVIFNLAVSEEVDNLKSPISSLIMGKPITVGSNYYEIHL